MTGQSTEALQAEAPMYPVDLYPDVRSSSTTPPPSSKRSWERVEERLKNRPDNPFYRTLRKVMGEIRAESQRKVEALGFPSWEAKQRHDKEESLKLLENYKKENGHSPPPPTLTEEQKIAITRQEKEELEFERPLPKLCCDCFEHIHPFFCPQRLRGFQSHGDDPSCFDNLQSLHPTDLNVHVDEGDPSNRMPEWWLEHWWGIPTPTRILRLPQWAKRDETVQRMINREEVDDILYYGDREENKNYLPRSGTVSLSPESSVEENAQSGWELERYGQLEESAAGNSSQPYPRESTTGPNKAHASSPSGNRMSLGGNRSHSAGRPAIHSRNKEASDLGMHETTRVPPAQSSRIKKRPAAKEKDTGKVALSNKIQTHAQDVLDFLTQDSSGCPTSFSHH